MKVVILAGGFGTRLSEETEIKPKPMIEIGGKPILWHIMKIYSSYGYNEFIVCLGYKGYIIKEYFANYYRHLSDITIDLATNTKEIHNSQAEPWKVTLIETGLETMTGGRVKRIQKYTEGKPFMLTYGDGVGAVDIPALVSFHRQHKKLITVTAVQPSGRFGALNISDDSEVKSFMEKPKGDGSWINGGFFVCQPEIFDYIAGDSTIFEHEPLERLAKEGQMMAYKHSGFWRPMDTLRDKNELNLLWDKGDAKWKVW
ncbi:glucose-1-phosphate cytidylyltransferase [Chryseosolibacter indicus]|uniref:Glucose-1-phosphate cytidylyltransferase n=1 Tax=Chryseosolibacter indicus TaxID=2782351 RepID=A0ABS5VTX7_9BACT|nr:glucose-1-phosphate cytidylyltransferase [Chryseosolibacter indicus]MBT1704878.1 glucose-1-phosphate cytidylyltransferase [Chryseosolibacter indicus]